MEQIPKFESAQKVDPWEENSSSALARTQTRDLSIKSPALCHGAIPLSYCASGVSVLLLKCLAFFLFFSFLIVHPFLNQHTRELISAQNT